MNKGALIFAHNSREVDYALHAIISGGLVKKYLEVPVSLVTDKSTVEWLQKSLMYSKAQEVFDKIILVNKPSTTNRRKLHDGLVEKTVPFVNANRASAWDLTPYDRTLLLDSDFFVFSKRLSEYWDATGDVLIADAMNDIYTPSRAGYHDRYVSDTGIHLLWATNVIFTKNKNSKLFFELVEFVRTHYNYYADLFRFSSGQYRNDIAFSVAKHILDGFETDLTETLPSVLTVLDRDVLHSVGKDGKLKFLVSPALDKNFCLASLSNTDVHIMNKDSITRNAKALLGLI